MFIRKLAERGWSISQFLTLVTLTGGLLASGQTALATDYFWAAPVSGGIFTPSSWSPSGYPLGSTDSMNFNLNSTGYAVNWTVLPIPELPPLGDLNVDNDTVTFNFAGRTLPLNSINVGNNAGDVGNATLVDSVLTAPSGAIGNAAGSQGHVTIDGSAGRASLSLSSIGYGGTGTLDVVNGGTFNVGNTRVFATYVGYLSGSQGTVTVDSKSAIGTSGLEQYVGYGGSGSLTVQNGSTALAVAQYIGYQAGSQGTVSVDGKNSSLTASAFFVGVSGTGAMSITNGATATADDLDVGFNAGSNGSLKVDGAGSTLNAPDFQIGAGGAGTVTVSNGGTINSGGALDIGVAAGSQGSLNLSGASSSLGPIDNVNVGLNGNGSLSVSSGAQLAPQQIQIANGNGSSGTMTIDGTKLGATVSVSGGLFVGTAKSTASVLVENGGTLNVRDLIIMGTLGGSSTSSMTFDGAGTVGNFPSFNAYQGAVHIQNGAVVNSFSSDLLAGQAGEKAALTIDGAGSRLNISGGSNGGLDVGGFGGTASLAVTNGAALFVGGVGLAALGIISVGSTSSVDIENATVAAHAVHNDGEMHLNGTINASVMSTATTSVLTGLGTINGILEFAGTLAPGDSPGTLTAGPTTWEAGGTFKLAINDANGTAGGTSGWGLLSVIGSAELNSIPHTIALESLTAGNTPGAISNFDPTHNYSWTFVTATGEVFNPGGFTIDTSGFDNPIYGHFSVAADSHTLSLNYTAPEPSTFVLAGLGVVMGCAVRLRRRTDKRKT